MKRETEAARLLTLLIRSGRPPEPPPFFAARISRLAGRRSRPSLFEQLDLLSRRLVPVLTVLSLLMLSAGIWLAGSEESEFLRLLSDESYSDELASQIFEEPLGFLEQGE